MISKNQLPVSYLLFTNRGRISRLTYWTASIFIWATFYILFTALNKFFSYSATWIVYPLLFWALIATATKRLHDFDYSGKWLLLAAIPVFGPVLLFACLGFRRGSSEYNRYGGNPLKAADYFKNNIVTDTNTNQNYIVDDVTQINPIIVNSATRPETISELQQIIKDIKGPISIGGGRFSMGGQTASAGSSHIDMRSLNKIIDFSGSDKIIKVQAGTRWCDIQSFIDAHGLSVKIMQTYANFTVGGALSVNCHGRYIGLGPLILSVKSLEVILADGNLVTTSRNERPDLFYAVVGCYNAIAVIATAEFELVENIAVERKSVMMPAADYAKFFMNTIRSNENVIFHNADIYPPHFKRIRAVSWSHTTKKPTVKTSLIPLAAAYPLERYFISAFSKSRFGKWRREYIYDPILFSKKKIHWRNYEAGYDVAELEPDSRKKSTYVLQEYFVPVGHFDSFKNQMTEIFKRHKVNVINVSVRHAHEDDGSLLAWAKEEVFAFVIWYKQYTDKAEKGKVAVWTRELIDAAAVYSGSYYLPYQVHATAEQFHRAYPNAEKLIDLKRQLDPDYKFRNVIWDTYYKP
jgi:FAD/FMN-containing dehydrogenase/uncharacterized membrane protein YhaH (DUF805 family)